MIHSEAARNKRIDALEGLSFVYFCDPPATGRLRARAERAAHTGVCCRTRGDGDHPLRPSIIGRSRVNKLVRFAMTRLTAKCRRVSNIFRLGASSFMRICSARQLRMTEGRSRPKVAGGREGGKNRSRYIPVHQSPLTVTGWNNCRWPPCTPYRCRYDAFDKYLCCNSTRTDPQSGGAPAETG
ncbi:unnamed protein product, partial [Iphiclides podalirius]